MTSSRAHCEKFICDAAAVTLNELQQGETWPLTAYEFRQAFRELETYMNIVQIY